MAHNIRIIFTVSFHLTLLTASYDGTAKIWNADTDWRRIATKGAQAAAVLLADEPPRSKLSRFITSFS